MYILGINGWIERSHDASACLIRDGKLVAMAEEERFVRDKHAYDRVPINASSYCLAEAGITLDEVDYVAWGWDYKRHFELRGLEWNYSDAELAGILFPKQYFRWDKVPSIVMIPHHLAHAASAFRMSNFDESAILVLDGQGEHSSTTLAYGSGNSIEIIRSFPIDYSLGYFYEAINTHIGFRSDDSGKTMGLAAYGDPHYRFDNIRLNAQGYRVLLPCKVELGRCGLLDEQDQLMKVWRPILEQKAGLANTPTYVFSELEGRVKPMLEIPQTHKDLAASVQKVLEDVIVHLAKVLVSETGYRNLCIAGGVGLNCIANGRVIHERIVDDIFIQPAANDAGVALGAALELYANLGFESKAPLLTTCWGPSFSNGEIKEIVEGCKLRYEFVDDIAKRTATLIADNKIIGWFQDRMEFGPRALGARSILANARDKRMSAKVNKLKSREFWRPLAPSILDEKCAVYLVDAYPSPFMLLAFDVKHDRRNEVPAIVHIDGTTRPQTVKAHTQPLYWRVIKNFEELTSTGLVLNTSFNCGGEAIVCTPLDAIRTFVSTEMDCLVMGNFLIEK